MGAITSQRTHAKSSDWPECEACGIRMNPNLTIMVVRPEVAPIPVRAIFRCDGGLYCYDCITKKWHTMRLYRDAKHVAGTPSPANLFSGGRPTIPSPSQENCVRLLEDG